MQVGWMMASFPGYLRAYHHGVWCKDGEYLDFGAQSVHGAGIVFLPTAPPGEEEDAPTKRYREREAWGIYEPDSMVNKGVACEYWPIQPQYRHLAELNYAKDHYPIWSNDWADIASEIIRREEAIVSRKARKKVA